MPPLREAARLEPENADARSLLAKAALSTGDVEAAVPALAAKAGALPWINDTFRAEITSLPARRATAILLGLSKTRWGALKLPLPLASIGMPGCTLYAGGELVLPLNNTAGRAAWTLAVPNNPWLLGRSFFNQAFVLDPPANRLGAVASNAAEGRIGGK